MAGMTTVLTKFSEFGNSRTNTTPAHTAAEPKLVIEKRRVAEGNQTMLEYSASVIHSTEDAAGEILQNKVSMQCVVRYPISGIAADVSAALVIFRDIVAGDEFANAVTTQEWLS